MHVLTRSLRLREVSAVNNATWARINMYKVGGVACPSCTITGFFDRRRKLLWIFLYRVLRVWVAVIDYRGKMCGYNCVWLIKSLRYEAQKSFYHYLNQYNCSRSLTRTNLLLKDTLIPRAYLDVKNWIKFMIYTKFFDKYKLYYWSLYVTDYII